MFKANKSKFTKTGRDKLLYYSVTQQVFQIGILTCEHFENRRNKPWYLEECSSTLAATYSSGTPGSDHGVTTVDMDTKMKPETICTSEHSGIVHIYNNTFSVIFTYITMLSISVFIVHN